MRPWLTVLGVVLPTVVVLGQGLWQPPAEPPVLVRQPRGPWQYVSSEHVQVLYTQPRRDEAALSMQLAEEALDQFGHYLDYFPQHPFQVVLHPSAQSLGRTRALHSPNPSAQPVVNRCHVAWTGQRASFAPHLKTVLAKAYLVDLFYGYGTKRAFQMRTLLNLPQWYLDGLAAWLGQGWTPADEALLRSLNPNRALSVLLHPADGPLQEVVQKSIWQFIRLKFGARKLAEVVYMTRLTRSVEGGLISVLGLSTASFSVYWQEYLRSLADDPRQTLPDAVDLGLKNSQRLVSAAWAPNGQQVAAVVAQGAQLQLHTWQPGARRSRPTGHRLGSSYCLAGLPVGWGLGWPLAWSPDGKVVLTAQQEADGGPGLLYYSVVSGESRYTRLPPGTGVPSHLAWSPNRQWIALSAPRGAQTDLLVGKAFSDAFKPLTNDPWDDLHPAWDSSSQFLYFASNRDTARATTARTADVRLHRTPTDLYRIGLEGTGLQRLSQTPFSHEGPAWPGNGGLWLQGTSLGLPNLEWLPEGAAEPQLRSNLARAQQLAPVGPDRYAALLWQNGRLQALPPQRLTGAAPDRAIPTAWALERLKEQDEDRLRRERERQDSLQRAAQAPPPDTVRTRPRIRYYVFDEGGTEAADSLRSQRQQRRRSLPPPGTTPTRKFLDPNTVRVRDGGLYRSGPEFRDAGLAFGVDPLLNLYMAGTLSLGSSLNTHHLQLGGRLYQDLRSTAQHLTYTWTGWVLWPGIEARRQVSFLEDSRIFRFASYELRPSLSLLLWPGLVVQANVGWVQVDRKELFLSTTDQNLDLDRSSRLLQPELRLQFNNLNYRYDFPVQGWRASATAAYTRHSTEKRHAFTTLALDVERYTPLFSGTVLYSRLGLITSQGQQPQRFFLGGLPNQAFDRLENSQQVPLDTDPADTYFARFVTPLHGTHFNTRNGTHVGVLNLEWRIPLARSFTRNLYTGRIYNFVWHLFYDLGTAWERGNPFSQRNPINLNTIVAPPFTITVESLRSPFVQGFGTGVSGTVFGLTGRLDLSWAVDDGSLLPPLFSVTLGKKL